MNNTKSSNAVLPPHPYGPIPSARQLRWHQLEVYGFLHFTVNTFTDKEWGYGDESPAVFNPTDFDARQIVAAAAGGGLRGLILTCKHHDGFCLWPTAFGEHSVKNSPWRNGRGDVVREISDACREQGLLFGVYLSPWDRNHAAYGRPEYLTYYRNQLRELMTQYGPVFEVWFDGANGGDGYYGGARERREIDRRTYYDWVNTWEIVREFQPDACLFSDAGPDIRWVGNEEGIAGDPCWSTLNRDAFFPGEADHVALNQGQRSGTHWLPAECDVSIRPGWFYHAAEDDKVRTPENLLDLFFKSVGRGTSFLVNLPPDRRGRIHETDTQSLAAFGNRVRELLSNDLARTARIQSGPARGNSAAFGPAHLIDGSPDTYWATDDDVRQAEVVLEFPSETEFNGVSLREYLPLGQRVDRFALDVDQNGEWREVARGEAIGNRRLIRLDTCRTTRIRLRVLEARAGVALSELAVFEWPAPIPKSSG
jgi:alpha-L-fucosidase